MSATDRLIAEALELDRRATPAPWSWFGNRETKSLHLATRGHGRLIVMDFVRWGMGRAVARFRDFARCVMVRADEMTVLEVPYRSDVSDVAHPDARMLARSRTLMPALARGLALAVKALSETSGAIAPLDEFHRNSAVLREIEAIAAQFAPTEETPA